MQHAEPLRAKAVLDGLRANLGDANFGYRVQGWFAHVLLRLGTRILEVNAQGHPDIKAQIGDEIWLVQVKSVLHSSAGSGIVLSASDVEGVAAKERVRGYLALLDCAEPVEFVVVPFSRISGYVGRPLQISSVRADRDILLSKECTEEFIDLLWTQRDRLCNLSFPILARRALNGDTL